MKRSEIVQGVSKSLGFKAEDSKKMVDFVLKELLESGLSGEGFSSPILKVTVKEKSGNLGDATSESGAVSTQKVISVIPAKQKIGSEV